MPFRKWYPLKTKKYSVLWFFLNIDSDAEKMIKYFYRTDNSPVLFEEPY